MSWENNLLEASFRGLTFDCIATDDAIARAVATHPFPYKQGDGAEDMGGESSLISITAIFFGDDYDVKLKAFTKALEQPGTGELVHPVFGAMTVQFVRTNIQHSADYPDSVSLPLQFIRPVAEQPLFNQTLTIQQAEAIKQTANQTQDIATNLIEAQVLPIVKSNDVIRNQQLRSDMLNVLQQARSQVAEFVSTVQDPIQDVRGWAGDLQAAMFGIVDLRTFTPVGILSDIKSVFAAINQVVLLPNFDSNNDTTSVNNFTRITKINAAVEAVSDVLVSEAQNPTLSAPEIETIVDDVRNDIQTAIDEVRTANPLELHHPMADALKSNALQVQVAARAIIELRPPLVSRDNAGRANYRLLAHRLYADHSRSTELFRLNPHIKNPNHLTQGDQVNAYAQ